MPTKTERAASTRAKIIAVARRLFATRGYDGTSIEAVLEQSQISRGALYHHFENKETLFEAVLEAVETDITAATTSARTSITDPVEALRQAFNTFLDQACETDVRPIILTDPHSVLGWHNCPELEARHRPHPSKHSPKFTA